MSNVYVISDLHLSHLNMTIRRRFHTIEEHDNYIIESWNSVVNKKDTIWILGDITMEKTQPYKLLKEIPLGIKCESCDCDIFCVLQYTLKDKQAKRLEQINEKDRLEKIESNDESNKKMKIIRRFIC